MTKDNAAGVNSICITRSAAATGVVETTWLIAAIAMVHVLGQAAVDTRGG